MASKMVDNTFDDPNAMEEQVSMLICLVVQHVFAVQPMTLCQMDNYIIMDKHLFDGVLLSNKIPITELPPCLLTKTLGCKEEKLQLFQEDKARDQPDLISRNLPPHLNVPHRDAALAAKKQTPISWDPIEQFIQFNGQSENSYCEQKVAIEVGVQAINKYCQRFGPTAATSTRGEVVHGAQGRKNTCYFVLAALCPDPRV